MQEPVLNVNGTLLTSEAIKDASASHCPPATEAESPLLLSSEIRRETGPGFIQLSVEACLSPPQPTAQPILKPASYLALPFIYRC